MQHKKLTGADIVAEVTKGRPVLDVVAGEIDVLATDAEGALRDSGLPVFQRGAAIVVPVSHEVPAAHGRTTIAAGLKELSPAGIIDHLNRAACFQHWNARAKKMVPCDPPALVAGVIRSRSGEWTLPTVAGVITTPTLRRDGSLLIEPGYDPATRLYHVPDPDLKMPTVKARPTKQDAEIALELLKALLSEFKFADDRLDRAVALSGLMSPVLRGMLAAVPLHGYRASTAGSGKSYLVDLAAGISTARPCPVLSAGEKDEETEKRLVGVLLAAYPVISVDNVNGELGGDLLCQAIERPLIRVRALGDSDIREIESRATFFATGNGLRVRGDMTRRTVICTLDPGVERPELRDFKQDPLQRVLADRGAYVAAVLTIIRAFLAAGSPGLLKPVASFVEWSNTVRSALAWLGEADPVQTMEAAREDDPELGELRQVIGAWRQHLQTDPYVVRQIIDKAFEQKTDDKGNVEHVRAELRDALLLIGGERGGVNARKVGKWLLKHEGRIVRIKDAAENTIETRFKRGGTVGGVAVWQAL